MNILIVNTYARGGGAATASRHLALALAENYPQHNVVYLTLREQNDKAPTPLFPAGGNLRHAHADYSLPLHLKARIARVWERAEIFWHNGFKRKHIFEISTSNFGLNLSQNPWIHWADLVHLHWVNFGMISLRDMARLGRLDKPVFWTLHDMWPITAVSPHLDDPNTYCSPWNGCENKWVEQMAEKKAKVLEQLNPHFIACSHWLGEKVKRSVFPPRPLRLNVIPNAIDTRIFTPKSVTLTAPPRRILIGSANNSDQRKGLAELLATMHALKDNGTLDRYHIEFDLIGHTNDEVRALFDDFPVHFHGFVESEEGLVQIYQNAYMLLFPSLYENLPCTIMESMSCGTPVVAFEVGGIPEMVAEGQNGFLAPKGDVDALTERVMTLLALPPDEYERLCSDAVNFVVNHYSYSAVAAVHLDLYQRESQRNGLRR